MKKIIDLLKYLVKHPLFSGTMVLVVGLNAVSFLNYLYHFVMGRLLGPSNYGELAAIISLVGLLGIIPGSVSLVITKQISSARDDSEVSALVVWFKKKIFITSLAYTLVILVLSPFIASFLKIQEISYLIMIAISFLFTLQSSLNRAILQGLLKFKEMVISILVENGAKLVISIILIYLGFQVGGAMMALIISSFLGLYVTIYYLKIKYHSKEFNLSPDIKSMLVFAGPVALQSIATTSLYSSDVILVKHFFPTHEAGIYAALSTLGKIIFFGAGPIGTVMFPLVSNRSVRGHAYKSIFNYSLLATILLIIVMLILYWLLPDLAIKLLYGTAYLGAASLLIWFGVFMGLFTLSSLYINYGLSLGKTSIVFLPLLAAILQIILILLFHQTLFLVVFVSIIVSALLLVSLLIYSTLWKIDLKVK